MLYVFAVAVVAVALVSPRWWRSPLWLSLLPLPLWCHADDTERYDFYGSLDYADTETVEEWTKRQ